MAQMSDTPTTVHLPPRGPDYVVSKVDVITIVDERVADHVNRIVEEKRIALEAVRRENLKNKTALYSVGAAAGLALGIGGTLLVQRVRRRGATK